MFSPLPLFLLVYQMERTKVELDMFLGGTSDFNFSPHGVDDTNMSN